VIVNCSPFSTALSSRESWALASKAPMQESMALGERRNGLVKLSSPNGGSWSAT